MAADVKATKCSITTIDNPKIRVEASFNPRELAIEKQVPWNEQKTSKGDKPKLEFTDAAPASLTVELLFDTYESGDDVYVRFISKLEAMTQIMEPESTDKERKRPPKCLFEWGKFPAFAGIVEQLSVKYTMFFEDGTPCRATASVKFKEYLEPKEDLARRNGDPSTVQGSTVGEGDTRRPDRYGDDHRNTLDKHGSEDGRLRPGAPVPGRSQPV